MVTRLGEKALQQFSRFGPEIVSVSGPQHDITHSVGREFGLKKISVAWVGLVSTNAVTKFPASTQLNLGFKQQKKRHQMS
jgi:hypothetical protein